MCNNCAENMAEVVRLETALADITLLLERVTAERDEWQMEAYGLGEQVTYLTSDRDQKRAERDALRDELAAVKRRVLAWQTGGGATWAGGVS